MRPRWDQIAWPLLALVITASAGADVPRVAVVSTDADAEIASALEAALVATLGRSGFEAVDREAMVGWLNEQSLSTTGLVREPLRVGQGLGAEYLVAIDPRPGAFEQRVTLLLIEVGSGNVLLESTARWTAEDVPNPERMAAEFARSMRRAVHRARIEAKKPAAVVLTVMDLSPHLRTRWLEPELREMLERGLRRAGYRVLRRERAELTGQETRLGVSGIVRPDAAVLAEAADRVVSAFYTEQTDPNLTADQTPIALTLELRVGDTGWAEKLTFTPAQLRLLPRKLAAAVRQKPDADAAPLPDREAEVRRLSKQLKEIPFSAAVEDHQRQLVLAQRILYLDPTHADACWYLARSQWALANKPMPDQSFAERLDGYIETMRRYLALPQDDVERTKYAYNALVRNVIARRAGATDDPAEREAIFDSMVPLIEGYVRWVAEYWANGGEQDLPPYMLSDWGRFESWWRSEPGRELRFLEWVAQTHQRHGRAPARTMASLHDALFKSYRKHRNEAAAARHLYQKLVGAGLKPRWHAGVLINESFWERPREAERFYAHLTAEQVKQLDTLWDRIEGRTAGPPLQAMYGDYFGEAESLYDVSINADPRIRAQQRIAELNVRPTQMPHGIFWTGFLETTESGPWVQAYYRDPETNKTVDALFLVKARGDWHRIELDDQLPGWARYISGLAQVGDDVLWQHSALSLYGGRRTVEPQRSLYRYRLKTGEREWLGLDQGLPRSHVWTLRRGYDSLAGHLYVQTDGGFLARYEEGELFIDPMRLKKPPIACGLAVHPQIRLMVSYGNSEVWYARNRDKKPRRLITSEQTRRFIPLPEYVSLPFGRHTNAPNHRIAIVDDLAYITINQGLLVVNLQGQAQHLWRPDGLFYWQNLGGFVAGNAPLPATTLTRVIHDDQNPALLWIVGQDQKQRTKISPDWKVLKARGNDTGNSRGIHRADKADEGQDRRGLYITAFDTRRQAFSKPVFVSGPVVSVRPHGEDLIFTGPDFGTIPKDRWPCDQPVKREEGELEIRTADTLHGQASEHLLRGDIAGAKAKLEQAVAADIAVAETRKMLKQLEKVSP